MILFITIVAGIVGYALLSSRISKLEQRGVGQTVFQKVEQSDSVLPPLVPGQIPSPLAMPTWSAMPSNNTTPLHTEDQSGKWLGKIGVIFVLAGISFFLKYAFDNGIIGVTGRIILGFISGIVAVSLGQLLRKKYAGYSDLLIGLGIGVFYLTIYAAHIFYGLFGAPVAYALMIVVTALSIVISVIEKTQTVVRLGVIGGFLTPFLISFSLKDPVSLWSYLLILDIGVLTVAYFYRWLPLVYVAFFGTVLTFHGWSSYYLIENFRGISLFFLILFWLVFMVTTVLHHVVRKEKSTGADGFLVMCNAGFLGFGLLALLEKVIPDFTGYLMVLLAVVYFIIGYIVYISNREDKYLNLVIPAISVVCLTVAVPLHFKGVWISLAWMIQALLMYFIAYSVKGKRLYVYGLVVYVIGLLRFLFEDIDSYAYRETDFSIIFNQSFVILGIATIIALVMAFILSKVKNEDRSLTFVPGLIFAFVLGAQVLVLFAGTREIGLYFGHKMELANKEAQASYEQCIALYGQEVGVPCDRDYSFSRQNSQAKNTAISVFWTLYATLLTILGFALRKKVARVAGLVLFIITALKVFVDIWSLGQLYRIISSIVFGVLALAGSFLYAKYKDRINDVFTK